MRPLGKYLHIYLLLNFLLCSLLYQLSLTGYTMRKSGSKSTKNICFWEKILMGFIPG